MENYKYRKLSFPNLFLRLAAMLAVTAFMTACPGKNDGPNGNSWLTAANFVSPTQMGSVQSVNPMNSVSLALNVIVESGSGVYNGGYNNGYPGYNNGYNTGYNNGYYPNGTIPGYSYVGTNLNLYNGPVAFQGTMTVGNNWYDLYNSGCQVAPGTYTVETATRGNMANAGMMSTVVLVANPGNIVMEINGGMVNGNRLVALPPGGIHVAQVNGIVCSPVFGGSFN
ncbi:hypothetical protein ACLVWU_11410 [Bdellovibrio sp. HCB290]|uniref:hypothetical protein n=1 Tax=Bdellovibrio sp. HCB290 TaxID=3394356 RepID=UPI0039B38AC5